MDRTVELSKEEMQTIMLCLRNEVGNPATALHEKLVKEGFNAFEAKQAATLSIK